MPDNYFARYLPFLIHVLLAGGIATAIISLSWLIGQRKPTRAKMSPYESGMAPVGDARGRFSVKFYLVAMLFILFDVEAIFIYPWAISLRQLKADGQAILLVDKHLDALIRIADRHVVIEKGHVVWTGNSAALTADPTVRQRYLQV